jgi:signal transduction histidine kinase
LANTLGELSSVYGDRFVLKGRKTADGNWSKHGMRRVLENLVTNAVKYGDPDRPITVCVESDSANRLILSVHNFGNPIPLEEQPTLFQQFRRATFAQEGAQKGWGLGLTVVRGIVESHGGEIKVESGPTEGTVFRVVLNQGLRS